ncbi:T6SS immunity protein Tdi1 domain-containing protein [Sphingomicrobium arenosum]|uniref:T6SS immunity protein Tdi1 domain-containing protein n=1 Tax=Sphingomicrobium arenosum TaxID=2233861 RepID=UPI002240A7D4|nr:T6SS immunity protein Tdi1 domain-containing protein [Sphingomicrobium arenosum]
MVSAYILPSAANHTDLEAWSSILPAGPRILRTSLFGDAFILGSDGGVHLLERGECFSEKGSNSEEAFWRRIQNDDQNWLLADLADECRAAGLILEDRQCYAFTVPPILGGTYTVANVWVAPWSEWFSLTADLFKSVKDLPDGAAVSFKVVD